MVIPSSATQNQPLKWNYGEGTQYNFKETLYQGNSSTLEVGRELIYYLVAPLYNDLDDSFNVSQGVPVIYTSTYWQNGTERQDEPYMPFAVPVDNWSLLSTIIDSLPDHTSLQHINTSTTWGYQVTYTSDNSSSTWQWIYSKSTGVLESMRYEVTTLSLQSVLVIERLSGGSTTILLNAVIIVGAGMFIAIVEHPWKKKIISPMDPW
jgi:hypothetical protein